MYLFKVMAIGCNFKRQFWVETVGNVDIILFVLNPALEYLEKN